MIKRKVTESKRKKSYLLAILLAGTAILSSCGSAANNSYSDTLNSIMEAASENANTDTYKDKTISAIIYGGKTSIWYYCGSIDKESTPTVYIMYGDGTYNSAKEYSLGELSKMADEEIISWVEDESILDAYYNLYSDEVFSIIEELGYGDLIYEDDDEIYFKDSVSAYDFDWVDDYFINYDFLGAEYCEEEYISVAKAEGKTLFEYLASLYGSEITTCEIYLADLCFSDVTGYDYMDLYERSEEAALQYNEKAQECEMALIQEIKRRVEKSGDMPAYQCGLSLTTDSTGNSVGAEVIYFEEGVSFADAASATSWSTDTSATSISIMSSDKGVDSGVIYESTYSGRKTGSSLFYMYMLVRVDDEDTVYKIDEIGTDGILIDEAVTFD